MGVLGQCRVIQVRVALAVLSGALATLQLGHVQAQVHVPPARAEAVGQDAAPPSAAAAAPVEADAAAPPTAADRPSRAGVEHASEPVREEAPLRWYGWQTLLTDIVSSAAIAVGASDLDLSVFTLLGMSGLVFGSPLVHLLNGHGSSAGISIGVRLGSLILVGVGGIVGSLETSGSGDGSNAGSTLAVLGLVGFAVAMVLDGSALARVRDEKSAERTRANTASIRPSLDPTRGRASVSFVLAMYRARASTGWRTEGLARSTNHEVRIAIEQLQRDQDRARVGSAETEDESTRRR